MRAGFEVAPQLDSESLKLPGLPLWKSYGRKGDWLFIDFLQFSAQPRGKGTVCDPGDQAGMNVFAGGNDHGVEDALCLIDFAAHHQAVKLAESTNFASQLGRYLGDGLHAMVMALREAHPATHIFESDIPTGHADQIRIRMCVPQVKLPVVLRRIVPIARDVKRQRVPESWANLASSDHRAAVCMTWGGQAKTWLPAAFEMKAGGASGTTTDTASTKGKGDTTRLADASGEVVIKIKLFQKLF